MAAHNVLLALRGTISGVALALSLLGCGRVAECCDQVFDDLSPASILKSSRVGSPPASPAAHRRGRAWRGRAKRAGWGRAWGAEGRSEPFQGSHFNWSRQVLSQHGNRPCAVRSGGAFSRSLSPERARHRRAHSGPLVRQPGPCLVVESAATAPSRPADGGRDPLPPRLGPKDLGLLRDFRRSEGPLAAA